MAAALCSLHVPLSYVEDPGSSQRTQTISLYSLVLAVLNGIPQNTMPYVWRWTDSGHNIPWVKFWEETGLISYRINTTIQSFTGKFDMVSPFQIVSNRKINVPLCHSLPFTQTLHTFLFIFLSALLNLDSPLWKAVGSQLLSKLMVKSSVPDLCHADRPRSESELYPLLLSVRSITARDVDWPLISPGICPKKI